MLMFRETNNVVIGNNEECEQWMHEKLTLLLITANVVGVRKIFKEYETFQNSRNIFVNRNSTAINRHVRAAPGQDHKFF